VSALECGDDAVTPDGGAERELLAPRVARRDEVLGSVLDPANGPTEAQREQGDQHILGVDVRLHPEAPADVRAVDRDLLEWKPEQLCQHPLEDVGGLRRVPDRHAAGLGRGDDSPRLERSRGDSRNPEHTLEDDVGRGERGLDTAAIEIMLEEDIGARRVDRLGSVCERLVDRSENRELLVVDRDSFTGVFRLVAVGRNDRRHGLADEANTVVRE
jgi:hypothetical protein